MISARAIEILHQVNASLRSVLTRLRPEQTRCLNIKPQDFSNLLTDLLQGAECLRNLPANAHDASQAEKESSEYRKNLEQLKQFLPDVHGRLLAERARLENTRLHLAAATAWAQARKKTL